MATKWLHPPGGRPIPAPQGRQRSRQRQPTAGRQRLVAQIIVWLPHVARRGQAVADVAGGAGADPVAEAALVGHHQLVARQAGGLPGQGIQRQVRLVMVVDARQAVHPAHPYIPTRGRHAPWVVEGRVHRRRRQHLVQHAQHDLGATGLIEPVMGQGRGRNTIAPHDRPLYTPRDRAGELEQGWPILGIGGWRTREWDSPGPISEVPRGARQGASDTPLRSPGARWRLRRAAAGHPAAGPGRASRDRWP